MQAFKSVESQLIPLDRSNVDTDAIIPKQFLKSVKRTGFGPNLFDGWRYLQPGEPDQNNNNRPVNPEFILNDGNYQHAQILLARENFGCGSSREHAVWALMDWGIRVVIATSFADIFQSNCLKNGLLPVALNEAQIGELFAACARDKGFSAVVDLEQQIVIAKTGEIYQFSVDPFRRDCLLEGLDDIGLTMQHADDIREFEKRHAKSQPWLINLRDLKSDVR